MSKIKYTCKNCGWETSIRQEWGDLRPKRCMNKKCNTSFLVRPDMLQIDRPETQVETPVHPISLDETSDSEGSDTEDDKGQERRHGKKRR